ncbi:CBS domain-containing protein [Bradyrhizobium diazoefficiens]
MKSWRKAVVGTQATVGDAIAAIESGSIQIALVLDDQNRLLGVVTDGDVRRGLLRGIPLTGLATDIMNRVPGVGACNAVARRPPASDAAEVDQAAPACRRGRPSGRGRDAR